MGFLDFLFKPKVELPKQEPLWESSEPVWERPKVNLEKARQYSNKGITNVGDRNPKKPWMAYLNFQSNKRKNAAKHQIHIGYFAAKEEAQQARWEFIENLK